MQGESPTSASTPARAVFLSYASEDATAAQRIAEALRAAGVEVWFDREELRGGDAWDHRIRQQIRDCRLFVPIISAHTDARLEGYFRREWKLAVDRTEDMASEVTFLVPVVIDETPNASAHVPDRFRHVHWTRIRGGEPTPALIALISQLVKPRSQIAESSSGVQMAGFPAPSIQAQGDPPKGRIYRRRLAVLAGACALAIIVAGYVAFNRLSHLGSVVPMVAVTDKSIAVLPFVDMSEKKDQEYLGDGIAEEVLDLLAKIPGLRVVGRTSSFQFKGHC
jgi:TIR domain